MRPGQCRGSQQRRPMTLRAFGATVVKPMATRSLDRILTLEYHDTSPSGKNQMGLLVVDGRIRRYPTKRFMRWLTNVEREFRTQLKGMQPYLPIQGECYAIVEYVPGDLITRDLPGMQDAVWHMCERFGIVTNDKWFQHLIWITRPMDRADPRLSLRIVPGSWSLEWAIRDLSGGVTLTSSLLWP